MKTFKLFITGILLVVFISGISAQNNAVAQTTPKSKTETFKVYGACGMCKTRIEKTVKAEGATTADWDAKTQMLTVAFDPSKTNKDALSKKLASVGHDTENYKAPDDVYAKLPGCCHYERAK
ncbi:MAG: heavy-metal-associated domain-containing protein [Bacteroidia bacterium]|nr:heavy-metal-associated domain-containing protein [Bacteroidia bacterium]